MKRSRWMLGVALAALIGLAGLARSADEKAEVKEKTLDAPHGITIKVRMEGPVTADVPPPSPRESLMSLRAPVLG